MAGVYIPGMNLPECCAKCGFFRHTYDSGWSLFDSCGATHERFNDAYDKNASRIDPYKGKLSTCPLVGIHDHGDLIDRDELAHEMWLKFCENCIRAGENMCDLCTDKPYIDLIVNYPAIISADKEEVVNE